MLGIFEGADRCKESRLNNDLAEVDLKMGWPSALLTFVDAE